jgi:hypothetical protein
LQTEFFDIVEHNLASFAKELESKLLDGWQISKTNPGDVVGFYGGTFTISLFRNYETVQRLRSRVEGVQEAPKLSRGESLARARAAKADKKSTGKAA